MSDDPGTHTLLLIGTDTELLRPLDRMLTEAGHLVLCTLNAKAGLAACKVCTPSLVILDSMLEGLPSGLDIYRKIRSTPDFSSLPILFLTGIGSTAYPEVADDHCVPGPLDGPTIIARVRTALRSYRSKPAAIERPKQRDLRIDEDRRDVIAGGTRVELTGMQFDLLLALAKAEGRVVTRETLLSTARGWAPAAVGRSVDVHLSEIRRKLGKFSTLLETVRGKGYRLRQDDAPVA